ncbi:MFS transporter [Microbacterium sp. A84]|uniref:MFS transporter n=1 Tax=Microbacterium sp. A84 TaxID=3450715 RepID=UPI003F43D6A3
MRLGGVFEPFRERNFSLYFAGQTLSLTGTWFQNLALSLVVLDITGSARALSGVTISQFLPMLLLSIPAGRIADRFRPRTVLMTTSLVSAALVAVLAMIVASPDPALPAMYGVIAALGSAQAFERVAAQTIIFELVGPRAFSRGVALSTVTVAVSRSIGPGLAGILFQAFGAVPGMVVNSVSFLIVFGMLALIRVERFYPRRISGAAERVPMLLFLRNRTIATLLVTNVFIALLALNFMVTLTSVVTIDFDGGGAAAGLAHALNAVGAIIGGFVAASIVRLRPIMVAVALVGFGVTVLINAAAPSLMWFLIAAPLLGLGIGFYNSVLNATAQLAVAPSNIGQMMSLMNIGNYGVVPFGALLLGWIIDLSSGRVALAIGGVAALLAAAWVWWRVRRDRPDPAG